MTLDEGCPWQFLSGYTTRPVARPMNGPLPQLIPMLSVVPVNAIQSPLPSGGRAPFGGPVQSVVSKAAMVPAPSMPRLCSLGVGVSFVWRARAPALKMKRLMVDSCIVEWVVQNEGRLFREIGRRLEQESMFEASVCGQRVFWFEIEGSPHFIFSSTSAETLCSVHESVHIIMKTFIAALKIPLS